MESYRLEMPPQENKTPEGIFINASEWDFVSTLLFDEVHRRVDGSGWVGDRVKIAGLPTLRPAIVASVLAVELYAKCLLQIERGKFDKAHNLEDFFAQASPKARQRIAEILDGLFQTNPDLMNWRENAKENGNEADFALDGVIKSCNKAFVEWRYHHEGVPTAEKPNASPLMDAMRMYLVELNPGWAKHLEPSQRT